MNVGDREPQAPQVFISYSHRDKKWLDRLQVHLAPLVQKGAVAVWADTRIRPGQEWRTEIESAMASARVAVLLVTPDFLASDFIQKNELPPLLEAAQAKGLTIFWVAVSANLYEEARFAKYQAVNDPSQPLSSLSRPKRESEWVQVARKIKEAVAVKPPPADSLFVVPYNRNQAFTGREEVLEGLREKLTSNSAAALSQTEAISGLGGIGKTQTALEYAYRYREDYTAVLWVTAGTEQTLSTGFSAIAQRLQLPEKDNPEQDQVRKAVLRWLESHERWLVVFDNADKPELLKAYLPHQHRGHILLTSRARVFDSAGLFLRPVALDQLSAHEARQFLLRRTGRESLDETELSAADTLAQELGYLPLALEQAAAYMVQPGTRFQDYLASFRKRRLELLERQQSTIGNYSRSVATTWAFNFSEVEQSPASADLLRLSGFLHPKIFPWTCLLRGWRNSMAHSRKPSRASTKRTQLSWMKFWSRFCATPWCSVIPEACQFTASIGSRKL